MTQPFIIEPKIYDISRQQKRGITTQIHISDIHFGKIDPKVQFDILEEQFLKVIDPLIVDCISIDGDLFDRLTASNSDATLYANILVSELIKKCVRDNTTLVLLAGTKQHDADQLKIFYPYLSNPDIDIRIIENIRFEMIKGCRVLCIPELYGIDESIYYNFLHQQGLYDMVFMHGTIEGSVYGNNAGQSRCFTFNDFDCCLGPIIAGHVHTGGCFQKYMYYNGSPIRWAFGEEEEKGFQIVLYDMDSRRHYVYKQPIKSFRYDTICIDDLLDNDPKDVIQYINNLKDKEGIDHLRIKMTSNDKTRDNIVLIENYYKQKSEFKLKIEEESDIIQKQMQQESTDLYNQYSYIFDKTMTPYDILAKFICDNEKDIYITGDRIKELITEI